MEQRFKLQAHEVWREKLVREGVYGQSGDFKGVLPSGIWDDSRFMFGRYSPRGRENSFVGHILFRPENGAEEENFFCAVDVHGDSSRAGDADFCKLGEFVFGGEHVDLAQVQRALARGLWGRVFCLNENGLRREGDEMPCDWAVFLSANGFGLWKWTMRDGVTWGKASDEGMFRWHDDETEAARFLARTPSPDVWATFQLQLDNANSDAAWARRWLGLEEEARFDELAQWRQGSRSEWETILRQLLLTDPQLQKTQEIDLTTSLFEIADWEETLMCDGYRTAFSPRLRAALALLQTHFDVRFPEQLPLCARKSYIDGNTYCRISEPTNHERLEAHQQLQTWAAQRGLSFD
jgi:hypothetical protein